MHIALNIFVGSTHKGSSYIHKYSVLITYVVLLNSRVDKGSAAETMHIHINCAYLAITVYSPLNTYWSC